MGAHLFNKFCIRLSIKVEIESYITLTIILQNSRMNVKAFHFLQNML